MVRWDVTSVLEDFNWGNRRELLDGRWALCRIECRQCSRAGCLSVCAQSTVSPLFRVPDRHQPCRRYGTHATASSLLSLVLLNLVHFAATIELCVTSNLLSTLRS